jgi:excisionase family DNA binding protein
MREVREAPAVNGRPVAPVPRLLLTRQEAAASMGMSLDHFERFVQPHVRMVRSGQKRLVSTRELERWIEAHARYAVAPGEGG